MLDYIYIVKADANWKSQFDEEKREIIAKLGKSEFLAIEHFGSTAIEGLDAKPIIDIMAGVDTIEKADKLLEPLCSIGYETSAHYNATLLDRRFLRRCCDGVRTHHLHLVVFNGSTWTRWISFRDRLRESPDLVSKYRSLKYRLAEEYRDNREGYTEGKRSFIDSVLAGDLY